MANETLYFDVLPRIVAADAQSIIEITPLYDHCRFVDGQDYAVSYYPTEEFAARSGWTPQQAMRTVRAENGRLRLTQFFEGEQEHVFYIEFLQENGRKAEYDFRVYSLREDLYARRPWKGDFHTHSIRSDGREAPGYVVGACRRIGLDFMAVTDHKLYEPSLEGRQAYADVAVDLRIYPGEEIHPPDNPVHMVNFGGAFSVNEIFRRDPDGYRREVAALQEELGPLPEGVDPYLYASCVWTFNKVREGGGLAVFCHPYWFTGHRYAPAGPLTTHLLDTRPFDAYEVLGGYHDFEIDNNVLQITRYYEERARGRDLPIVGVSDAHGCERGTLFGWYHTIVFAPSPELDDLKQGIRDLYSVAVFAFPGAPVQVHGPFRLVKYAMFLLRNVFPGHDALCEEEGRLMLRHLAGDPQAAGSLAQCAGRVDALYARYWG